MSVTKDVQFYSLPDHVFIEFSSDLPVKSLTVDFRSALHSKLNNVTLKPAEGEESFAAGTRHTLEIPISELGDTEELALYPISASALISTPHRKATTASTLANSTPLTATAPLWKW